MLTCPLVVLFNDSNDSSSVVTKDTQNATHIELRNLNQEQLFELFYNYEGNESNYVPFSKVIGRNLSINTIMSLLMPGLNVSALYGIQWTGDEKVRVSGINITLDVIRSVEYGKESTTSIALDISVNDMYIKFNNSADGLYMLASDAYNQYAVLGDDDGSFAKYVAEAAPKNAAQTMKKVLDDDATLPMMVNFINQMASTHTASKDADGNWAINGSYFMEDSDVSIFLAEIAGAKTAGKDPVSAVQELIKGGAPVYTPGSNYKWIDVIAERFGDDAPTTITDALTISYGLTMPEQYANELQVYNTIQRFTCNGDMGDGIAKAYADQKFNGGSYVVSGKAHAKLYFNSDMKTEYVGDKTVTDSPVYEGSYETYAITESGLSLSLIQGLIQRMIHGSQSDFIEIKAQKDIQVIVKPADDGSWIKVPEKRIGALASALKAFPLSELEAEVSADLTIAGEGKEMRYDSNALFQWKCVIGYQYENTKAIFDTSKDGYGVVYDAKDIKLALSYDSSLTYDGKKYSSNGMDIDLSKELRNIIDGAHGSVYDYISMSDAFVVGKGMLLYYSWFGFGIDKSGEKYNLYFDDLSKYMTYDMFLKLLRNNKDTSYLRSIGDSNDATEQAAKKWIESFGGYCSHDVEETQKSMDSIKESINGSEKKDNSMLILGIVIAIIAILAVIGFAMIIRSSKR